MHNEFTIENLKKVTSVIFYPDRKQVSFFLPVISDNSLCMGVNRDWDKADCDARSLRLILDMLQVITGYEFEIGRQEETIEVYHRKQPNEFYVYDDTRRKQVFILCGVCKGDRNRRKLFTNDSWSDMRPSLTLQEARQKADRTARSQNFKRIKDCEHCQ
jgi:hypothetical protein